MAPYKILGRFYRVPFKSLLRMKIKWAIVSFLCTNFFSFVFMGKAVAIRKQYLWFLHLDSQVKLKTNKPTHPLSLTQCAEINPEVFWNYENWKRFLPKMKVHRNKNSDSEKITTECDFRVSLNFPCRDLFVQSFCAPWSGGWNNITKVLRI